ncbi:unnamed protein product [marine sediment metagenome]|uniref:Uncharacterized protein n=1 Tax=marine sediment metagenome TaxID=412755 RepID=X0RTF9_9ZZZZ
MPEKKKKKKDVNVSKISYLIYRRKSISTGDIPDGFQVWKAKKLGD